LVSPLLPLVLQAMQGCMPVVLLLLLLLVVVVVVH